MTRKSNRAQADEAVTIILADAQTIIDDLTRWNFTAPVKKRKLEAVKIAQRRIRAAMTKLGISYAKR